MKAYTLSLVTATLLGTHHVCGHRIFEQLTEVFDQEPDMVPQNLQFSWKNAEKRIYTRQTAVALKGIWSLRDTKKHYKNPSKME